MPASSLSPIPESRPVPPRPERPRQRTVPPPTERHPFIQRHPFYGRFVVALEVLAVILVLWGLIAGVRVWWGMAPSVAVWDRQFDAIDQMQTSEARYAGIVVLINWLGLAGSVVCISMVGRLLLSIEGLLARSGDAEATADH